MFYLAAFRFRCILIKNNPLESMCKCVERRTKLLQFVMSRWDPCFVCREDEHSLVKETPVLRFFCDEGISFEDVYNQTMDVEHPFLPAVPSSHPPLLYLRLP